MAPCPSLDQLTDLLADTLQGTDRTSIEGHLDECSRCQQALESLARGDANSIIPGGSPRPHEFHPDFQPSLVNRIELQLQNTSQPSHTDSRSSAGDNSVTAGLHGRFIKKEVLGKGGQGEVWLALDPELGRDVALKVLPFGLKGSQAITAKFRHEAEVTGKLEHPNIVPIYEAGREQSDQTPYYVMRVLRDETLQAAILRFHQGTWTESGLRELLGRFIDVCQAVAYAHSRGVIHRDLKPQNVMLGQFGETLVVDWGLAKVIGRDEEHDSDEGEGTVDISAMDSDSATKTGSIKGTPKYMSPEQAAGRVTELGPPSDIYSLGVVLYCVLTGEAPFPGKSTSDILRRVQTGDFPPPRYVVRSLRDRNPDSRSESSTIPQPLEAICLRAMSLRPSDRYRTAAALAEDVQRWLADEPVSAWHEPVIVRTKRWVRHHQTLVTSAAAILLVASVSLTALSIIVTGKNNELAKSEHRERTARWHAEEQERAAIAARELAETNAVEARRQKVLAESSAQTAREQSQLALKSLESVIFDVQKKLVNVPGTGVLRRTLLQTAITHLKEVSDHYTSRALIDQHTATALIDLVDVFLQIGEVERESGLQQAQQASAPNPNSAIAIAEQLCEQAVEMRRKLVIEHPADIGAQRRLSVAYNTLGDVHVRRGRLPMASENYHSAFEITQRLVDADPKNVDLQRDLAYSHVKLGDESLWSDRLAESLNHYQKTLEIRIQLASAVPMDESEQRALSIAYSKLGVVKLSLRRLAEAMEDNQKAFEIRERIARANPNNATDQRHLSFTYFKLGNVSLHAGRVTEALGYLQKDLEISQKLAAADPTDVSAQRELSLTYNKLGEICVKHERLTDALGHFQQCLELRQKLADADRSDSRAQFDLAMSHSKLGNVRKALFDYEAAITEFQRGLTILMNLIEDGRFADVSIRDRDRLEKSVANCQAAILATGDWSSLLTQEPHRLPDLLVLRLSEFARQKRFAELIPVAEKLRTLEPKMPTNLYHASRGYSMSAGAIDLKEMPSNDEMRSRRDQYLELSLACLKEAIAAGWDDFDDLRKDKGFTPLRELPEFKALFPK